MSLMETTMNATTNTTNVRLRIYAAISMASEYSQYSLQPYFLLLVT